MRDDEKIAEKHYDKETASAYHSMRTKDGSHGWFYNEHLEMPSTLSLLGKIKGKKILDFGCGTGIYAKLLTKKGANVKGFDISKEMINIAKKENPKLELKVGSGYNIPFKEQFDMVLGPLVVHYFDDWNKMLKEVKRVLKKNGIFIFSTNNPVEESLKSVILDGKKVKVMDDYFTERRITKTIKSIIKEDGKIKNYNIIYYHKTYETIINTLIKNGFELLEYKDCKPSRQSEKYFPEEYKEYNKKPLFTAWKWKRK